MPERMELRMLELKVNKRLYPAPWRLRHRAGVGQVSPNGLWLVYQSAETTGGRDGEIMVRPFPNIQTRKWVISRGIGPEPDLVARRTRDLLSDRGRPASCPFRSGRSRVPMTRSNRFESPFQ
jgi:hypothetical protein